MLTLKENKPGEPLLHEEPIYLNDNIMEELHQKFSFCFNKI